MIAWLAPGDPFPPVSRSLREPNGLLAASRHLDADTLLRAYRHGIFPWYSEPDPVLWWSPDPRAVLFPQELRVRRSFRKRLRAVRADPAFELRVDADFAAVMHACAAPRARQDGTWIGPAIVAAYGELHRRGLAHSIEVFRGGERVGGLYGVSLGRIFFGESMFTRLPDASKIALAALVQILLAEKTSVIDCQQHTPHLAAMGARNISRVLFCEHLAQAADQPGIDWSRYRDRSLNDLLLPY